MDQSYLLNNIIEFNDKSTPKSKKEKDKKEVLVKVHTLNMKVED